jgi:hypothetical protein
MDKIDAARYGKGLIELEGQSADQVKQAIQKVSRITAEENNTLAFEGTRIIAGHGFAQRVNCFDVYQCPNGYLLHTYMDNAPNWAVAGKTVKEILRAAPDQTVAKRAHGLMVQKGLASTHDH